MSTALPLLPLPSPPSSDGLPSPLSTNSDSTAPPLSEDELPFLSSDHSDWGSESHEGDEEGYDVIGSREFSRPASVSEEDDEAGEHMKLSFPDPLQQSLADNSEPEEEEKDETEYSLLLDVRPKEETQGHERDEGEFEDEDDTPAGSRLVENINRSPSPTSTLDLLPSSPPELPNPTISNSVDIEAWVKLTGDASSRQLNTGSPAPPPLPPTFIPTPIYTPLEVSPLPTPPIHPTTAPVRFLSSQRSLPSSAARQTLPTKKGTRERADSIKDKLELLAEREKEKKLKSWNLFLVVTVASAVLAAAAGVRGAGLFAGSGGGVEVSTATVSSSSAATTTTSLLATTLSASAIASSSSPKSPTVQHIAPVSVPIVTPPPSAAVVPNCSMLHPGACALALVDSSKTSLVDIFSGGSGARDRLATAAITRLEEELDRNRFREKKDKRRGSKKHGGKKVKKSFSRSNGGGNGNSSRAAGREGKREKVGDCRHDFVDSLNLFRIAATRLSNEWFDKLQQESPFIQSHGPRLRSHANFLRSKATLLQSRVQEERSKLVQFIISREVVERTPNINFRPRILLEQAKSESMYRVIKAVRGYGRLRRGEVGIKGWKVYPKSCEEVKEKHRSKCERLRPRGKLVR